MSLGLLFILNTIVFGSFIGFHTKKIYTKIGIKPINGFIMVGLTWVMRGNKNFIKIV